MRGFHTMYAYFAELGPYDFVRAGKVDVTCAGQGDARGRKGVLHVKSIHQLAQLVFAHLENKSKRKLGDKLDICGGFLQLQRIAQI